MKKNVVRNSLLLVLSLLLTACATDGLVEETAPTVDLNPRLLLSSSNVGEDSPVMLEIQLQTGALAGNPFEFSDSPVDIVSSLYLEGMRNQGFSVYTSEEYLPEGTPRLIVQIEKLQYRTKESSVSSTVTAEVRLKATAVTGKVKKTIVLETRREKEVALEASMDEIGQVVSRALSQAVERTIKDQDFLQTLKTEKTEESQKQEEGLFGF